MKRAEHVFQFSGRVISQAAAAEYDYHRDRLAFWKSEQEKAIEHAKASGVDVREYNVTGGKQVNIVVDPEVSDRLTLCANKINSHRASADRFQIEAAAYATQGDRSYDLHPDDVVYFRLAGVERED